MSVLARHYHAVRHIPRVRFFWHVEYMGQLHGWILPAITPLLSFVPSEVVCKESRYQKHRVPSPHPHCEEQLAESLVASLAFQQADNGGTVYTPTANRWGTQRRSRLVKGKLYDRASTLVHPPSFLRITPP